MLFSTFRTDQQLTKKADLFGYSLGLRRVRRFPQPRRQEKFPNAPMAYDDFLGRDAWEFSWRIIGTDVLYKTARFQKHANRSRFKKQTEPLKRCRPAQLNLWVTTTRITLTTAVSNVTWSRRGLSKTGCRIIMRHGILFWADQHYFYPLRTEAYDKEGRPVMIEERVAKLMNPRLKERGYHNLITLWWDPQQDFYSYGIHDAMQLKEWSQADKDVFFSPDFMRRTWFPAPLKTQAGISLPEEFFLRPQLHRDKFPASERSFCRIILKNESKPKRKPATLCLRGSRTAQSRGHSSILSPPWRGGRRPGWVPDGQKHPPPLRGTPLKRGFFYLRSRSV